MEHLLPQPATCASWTSPHPSRAQLAGNHIFARGRNLLQLAHIYRWMGKIQGYFREGKDPDRWTLGEICNHTQCPSRGSVSLSLHHPCLSESLSHPSSIPVSLCVCLYVCLFISLSISVSLILILVSFTL